MCLRIYRLDKSINTVGFKVVVDEFVIGSWYLILAFSFGFCDGYGYFFSAIFFKEYESYHTIDRIEYVIDGNGLMIIGSEVFYG